MGSIYVREILGYQNPRVGLMSIGTEAGKGNEFFTRECYAMLSEAPINFAGNVEGHGLFNDPVEVVVCDGFVGNIVLKTVEGLAKSIFSWIKREISKSPIRLLGAWLSKGAFAAIRKETSTDEYGGSPLLGGERRLHQGSRQLIAHGHQERHSRGAGICFLERHSRIIEAIEHYHEKIAAH